MHSEDLKRACIEDPAFKKAAKIKICGFFLYLVPEGKGGDKMLHRSLKSPKKGEIRGKYHLILGDFLLIMLVRRAD